MIWLGCLPMALAKSITTSMGCPSGGRKHGEGSVSRPSLRKDRMTLTIEIPNELGERLRAEAEKRGQALPEYVLPALEALATEPIAPLETNDQDWDGPDFLKPLLEIAHSIPDEE